jgi:hypothetical protein
MTCGNSARAHSEEAATGSSKDYASKQRPRAASLMQSGRIRLQAMILCVILLPHSRRQEFFLHAARAPAVFEGCRNADEHPARQFSRGSATKAGDESLR